MLIGMKDTPDSKNYLANERNFRHGLKAVNCVPDFLVFASKIVAS
jgi:hypothetical protein